MTRLSADGIRKLRQRAQEDIDAGILPSCQYALALDGEVVVTETLGTARPEDRYSIWSATKPVFSSLVWQLMGEGKLDPTMRVVDVWPEFGEHGKDVVTIDHLLLFTAGFPAPTFDTGDLGNRSKMAETIIGWTLDYEPGSAYAYHGVSAHLVMEELVARVAGDHRVALRERVLGPMGLDRLELGVPIDRQGDVRPVVNGGEPATAEEVAAALGLPSVPPELAEMLANAAAGAQSASPDIAGFQQPHVLEAGLGGAGAVSDAASLALFYQELLHNKAGVFDPEVLADVTGVVRNSMAGAALGILAMRTRGLEVQGDDPTAGFRSGSGVASPRTFGHGGAMGQIGWSDPDSGLSFVYLTDGNDLNAVRQNRRVRELAAAAVECLA